MKVSPGNLSRIARLPEVVNVWPVDTYSLPEPSGENLPELLNALPMIGADNAHAAGYTGTGMRIGIIDTGVDIDHPDFGGTGVPGTTPFPNEKIVAGWDFVGDDYTGPSGPAPVPDPNPDDCGGHGSHVAGIAAANGVAKGVAPDAVIGAYRVFGCDGSTSADIMIAAMERAYLDGMHVVNMSIGSAFQSWPQYPTGVAGDRLVARGVVVACSIGNSGTSGLYANGAPGVGNDVIGTASFENTMVTLYTLNVNGTSIGYQTMSFSEMAPQSGTEEIVYVGQACNANPLLADPSGKVALIVRGTCSFAEKAVNAISAGATAVVVYNNAPGVVAGTLGAPLDPSVPVVGISDVDGLFIRSQEAPVMMTWTTDTAEVPNALANRISSFSSYGLTAELGLKPDIGAPGGNVFSTIPIEQGTYGNNSGTSMASPHMAGMAALLRQAHPGLPASAVRGVLQNNAEPKNWQGNPALGLLDQTHRQGAGLARIDRAIAATTRVTPSKLSLGESESGPVTSSLTIWNNGASDATYDLSHVPALSTGPNTFPVGATTGFAGVVFSVPSVAVPAGGSASVDVTITANAGLGDRSIYGGYIVATPQGGGEVVRVPYSGFKGDYQSIQVLTPTASNYPWLAQWNKKEESYDNRPAGGTFTMAGDDIPFILVRLGHPSRHLKVELFFADSGLPVHDVFYTAFEANYLPRNGLAANGTATSFFALAWDGTRMHNNGRGNNNVKVLPNGDYIMKMSVLKALGDASNPAHWETWTSPVVTIARP
ncbi:MAG TPA: S8 family serine peptidase [Opitutaceae bacterium]